MGFLVPLIMHLSHLVDAGSREGALIGGGVNDHLNYNNNSANKQDCKNDARHHVGEDIAVCKISFAIFVTLHTHGSGQGAFYNIDEAWFLGVVRFSVVHSITVSIGGVV